MRPSILALAGATIAAALALAITSRPPRPTVARAEPAQVAPTEPGVAPPFAHASWSGSARGGYTGSGANANGSLRADPAPQARRAPAPPEARRPLREAGSEDEFLADATFRQLDLNGDGVLTGAEIPTAFRRDINARGAITHAKFETLFESAVQEARANRSVVPHPSGAEGGTTDPASYRALDTDRDGTISRAEWRTAGRSALEFDRADADRDGSVSRREALAAQALAPPSRPPASRTGTDPAPATSLGAAKPAPAPSRADAVFAYFVALASGAMPDASAVRAATRITRAAARPAPAAPAGIAPTATVDAPAQTGEEVATLPLPLTGAGVPYWELRNTENLTALYEGQRPDVVFLGDSVTDFLQSRDGKPLWDEFYAPLGAVNFGVGAARTSHVLWQVETGQVALARPKVVVLLIGSNNIGIANQEPDEVAAGVEKIVTELGAQLPDTRVLLLGLLPRGPDPTDPFRPLIADVNDRIAGLHDGRRVTFLDIGAAFLSADGSLSPDVMPDGAHPSELGYTLYSAAIWPTLTGLLERK